MTGRRKTVPKSAAPNHSYPPAEMKGKKRQATSASTQRVSIQPPVVGVQPGKVLELRTTIGLLRAKALLQQQNAEAADEETVQKAAMVKGQLKHGRLQPLGVVSNHIVDSDQFMGVISVHSKTCGHQRPRSSTTPTSRVHFDLPIETESDLERQRQRKVKRRSYSAILSRTVDTEHLYHLLSVSKQTALVPNQSEPIPGSDRPDDTEKLATVSAEAVKMLPPVVRHGELGMKIELKGLRANEAPHGSSPSRSLSSPRGRPVDSPTTKQAKAKTKLPPITNSPSISPPKSSSGKTSHESEASTSPRRTSIHTDRDTQARGSSVERKLSIVSIGEVPAAEDSQRRNSSSKRKRHSSGKLSLGWSSPRPIETVLGSPLHIPHAQQQQSELERGGQNTTEESTAVEADLQQRTMSPNMTISVNVNEFLLDTAVDSP